MTQASRKPREKNSTPEDRILAVVLHGWIGSPRIMTHVSQIVQQAFPNAYVLVPPLPLGLFSMRDPVQITRQIIELIDDEVTFRAHEGMTPFTEILLIGHSLGALLARKVYLFAGPETSEARFEDSSVVELSKEKPWFSSIKRIVLLAGMNRGWTISHHLSIPRAIALSIGTFFGDLMLTFTGARFMIHHVRKGAPFITELRLQWLALKKHMASTGQSLALTVQLLGTVDDLVSPEDNVDLATGQDFVYLDVPFSGHADVIQMDDSERGRLRRAVFQEAISADSKELLLRGLAPEGTGMFNPRQDISDVIFVIHGIRDFGYWTQRIARKVEELGNAPPRIYASETSSYGYFAMFPFLLPSRRRDKVHWLMDQYVEAKSLYPDARFSYVGHSNGTYLLARALKEYRGCRFQRVVFAGSVVRTDYNWSEVIERGQSEAVLNYVATGDWIVACFPGALEILRLQDLGSAGHNGFKDRSGRVFQFKYIRGGHGAALSEQNWKEIASFIVKPISSLEELSPEVEARNRFVIFLGWISPLIWLGIVLSLFFFAWSLAHVPGNDIVRTLAVVAYVWLIWTILTKV